MKRKQALINGTIFTGYQQYSQHVLLLDGDRIAGVVSGGEIPSCYHQVDLAGAYVSPGLVDLQIYGAADRLFSQELTVAALQEIEKSLLRQGCTSFNLTLATNTLDVFTQAIEIFREAQPRVALGLHLEGPFLNVEKRGAHPAELVKPVKVELLENLLQDSDEIVNMMTVAPELMNTESLHYLHERGVLVSAGHSNATFQESIRAFNQGIGAATHLWNAMSSLHHRDLGLPGAVMQDERVSASIIVDGIHVSYPTVKLSKALMGERLFLITDAVTTCRKGIYQHAFNGDHFALPDGTLSGSALTMLGAVQNCVEQVGISLEESLRMATLYPARLMKRRDIGNLEAGSLANILAFDQQFKVKSVWFEGDKISLSAE